jgi:hypothetical protein
MRVIMKSYPRKWGAGGRLRLLYAARLIAYASVLASAGALGASACVHSVSRVEQGETFLTGDPAYDEFFTAVRDARAEAQRARTDEQAARTDLVRTLGLSPHVDADDAVDAAEERAKKLKNEGTLLHLQLTPELKLMSFKGPGGTDDANVLKALEDSARNSLAVSKRLSALRDRMTMLEKRRAELSIRSRERFRTAPVLRRHEIEQELDASRDVIATVADEGEKYAGFASKFVLDLARAIETGATAASSAATAAAAASASATAAPAAPPPRRAPPSWKRPTTAAAGAKPPPPRPAAPTKPAAAPAAPTKQPAKPGNDFEP